MEGPGSANSLSWPSAWLKISKHQKHISSVLRSGPTFGIDMKNKMNYLEEHVI